MPRASPRQLHIMLVREENSRYWYENGNDPSDPAPNSSLLMKACPGLRSGIDRFGGLSFVIRGIPSSFRPPIRHSGGGRNPGGEVWVAPNFHTLGCPPLPAWGIVTKTCAGLRSGMTLPALDRDFETHQSPQSSFPRRRESTHQSRAAERQSRNRRQSPQGQCSSAEGYARRVEDYARRGACPPLGSGGVAESTVPIRCTYPQLQLFTPWCAGPCRHQRLVRK